MAASWFPTSSLKTLWLIGTITCSLGTVSSSQDKWAYFHPELVKSFGCKVTDTEYVLNGSSRGEMVWEATAFATREGSNWQQEVAVYPHTLKGRHQAEKACTKWQDEAEKRVRAVQK